MSKEKTKKFYKTKILVANNVYVAGRISGILAGIIGDDEPGKQLCRTLENDNNNQMIITAVTTKKKYEKFKRIVEKHYPGLCLFDI